MIHTAYEVSNSSASISPTKRGLILHDSLTVLLLTLATLALFGVTLFLFRSFEAHREGLATRWAEEGNAELQQGQPAKAVASLRAALSYAPDEYQTQLLLAQALADAGETEQATNYFLNLWSAKPGDGFLNLQLARLERMKGNRQDAITYYRASIFGDWRGDGAIKRRDVRLELVDYLTQQHDFEAARVELLIAAGNAPPNLHLNKLFAEKLLATGDQADALNFYQKAITDNPRDSTALAAAGRIVYDQGDYGKAHTLLLRAVESERSESSDHVELEALTHDAGRLVELSLSRNLPARERAQHLLAAAKIAQARLVSCSGQSSTSFADLQMRWRAANEGTKRNALAENAAGQDGLSQLIFDTERQTAEVCGKATGDDALLLKLAEQNGASEQP